MIIITVIADILQVSIPPEAKFQAPLQLEGIWREEFVDKPDFLVELTEPVRDFVQQAKLNQFILVCQ